MNPFQWRAVSVPAQWTRPWGTARLWPKSTSVPGPGIDVGPPRLQVSLTQSVSK